MIHLLGWLGTLLVLASYAQLDTVRLRQIGLAAGLVLIVFNVLLAIWSNVALEVALLAINARRLHQLRSSERPSTGTE